MWIYHYIITPPHPLLHPPSLNLSLTHEMIDCLFSPIHRHAEQPCTYLTDNFSSRCAQIYNYHRLLSWDSKRGLHIDIFKVLKLSK